MSSARRLLMTVVAVGLTTAGTAHARLEEEVREPPPSITDDVTVNEFECAPGGLGPNGEPCFQKAVVWTSGVDPHPGNRFRGGIFIARASGIQQRKLTTFTTDNRSWTPHGVNFPDDHPSLSPDGRRIVFTSNRANGRDFDIYVMNVNGSAVGRLAPAPGEDSEPVFRGANEIVFATERFSGGDNLDIAAMNADGTNVRRITSSPLDENEPAVSRDGTKIAFTRIQTEDGHEKDVFLTQPDGNPVLRLTSEPREDHDATFNPAGTQVVITSERPPTSLPFGNVHKLRVSDGASLADLTADTSLGAGDPSWSPDGLKIAYFRSALPFMPAPQLLHVMNANGTQKGQVAGEGVVNVHPHIGILATDTNGTPEYLASGATGVPKLSRRRVRTGRTQVLRFAWFHPRRWKQLDDFELRLLGRRGRPALVLRFSVGARAFSLRDPKLLAFQRSARAGRRARPRRLREGGVTLELSRSRVIKTSKKTLTLRLGLRFARRLAGNGRRGRSYRLVTHARTKAANYEIESFGRLRVLPPRR